MDRLNSFVVGIFRVKLWLYHPEVTPEHEFTKQVPKHEVQKFTVLQLACLWALWNLKESKWGKSYILINTCSVSFIVHISALLALLLLFICLCSYVLLEILLLCLVQELHSLR